MNMNKLNFLLQNIPFLDRISVSSALMLCFWVEKARDHLKN